MGWDRVYLLGYYDHAGKSCLTTWRGGEAFEWVHVLVKNCDCFGPPVWDAYPGNATVYRLSEEQRLALAQRRPNNSASALGSRDYLAFGWYLPQPGLFMRHTKLTDEYRRLVSTLSVFADEKQRLDLWERMSARERDKVKECPSDRPRLPPEVVAWVQTSRPGPQSMSRSNESQE